MTISEAVKEFRSKLGYSQQKFATVMNLALRSVARYEADQIPRRATLEQFSIIAEERGFEDLAGVFRHYIAAKNEENYARLQLAVRKASNDLHISISDSRKFIEENAHPGNREMLESFLALIEIHIRDVIKALDRARDIEPEKQEAAA
jgi:transcriptional regulator with XRE-family HTH domain